MNGALAPNRYELPSISVNMLFRKRPTLNASLLAFPHRHEGTLDLAVVQLARAPDLLVGIRNHFGPLRDPADGACEREDRRKHTGRDAERLVDNAGIKIHVGVEFAAHEIIVFERDLLERHRELE